jgi:3-hydroxyisobutyrate dehydrogenase-like beta-hydroxyacid dehydrogenase
MPALGFIGLGVMGEAMCANLVKKSGQPVHGADLHRAPLDRLSAIGLRPEPSIEAVTQAAEILFLSLPSGKEVEQVLFGKGGIASAPNSRVRTVVDMSTSPVSLTRELHARLARRNIVFVDAPVARTRQAAIEGTLSIMVGAEPAVFEAIKPLLSCMGSDLTLCGGIGCGQVVKILNNMVLLMNVNALAEALAIGRSAGVDGKLLFETMTLGSADSFALRVPGLKALVLDHFPELAFPTDYAIKDIKLALELAQQVGIPAEGAAHTCDVLQKTSEAGYGKAYYPAMIRAIDKRH